VCGVGRLVWYEIKVLGDLSCSRDDFFLGEGVEGVGRFNVYLQDGWVGG
jgi:hypothetical protein